MTTAACQEHGMANPGTMKGNMDKVVAEASENCDTTCKPLILCSAGQNGRDDVSERASGAELRERSGTVDERNGVNDERDDGADVRDGRAV